VADLCNFINPDLVVVGGELSGAGDLLLDPLRRELASDARIEFARDRVDVRLSDLGLTASLAGAAAVLLRSDLV
jgi:predicted NBD/HSP70 family sugar kinase